VLAGKLLAWEKTSGVECMEFRKGKALRVRSGHQSERA
jgi:hypothetical protein